MASTTNQKKRKAEVPSTSITQPRPPISTLVQIPHRDIEEEGAADAQEEEPRDELYCVMRTDVVGIQHYRGLVGPQEEVSLVREPHNPYDYNAIQVKNISNIQVGHLPRNVAAKLAPLMDGKLVNVEGVIHEGNLSGRKQWKLSISLKFYADASKRDIMEPKLVWATPGQRGFPSRNTKDGLGTQIHHIPGDTSSLRAGVAAGPSRAPPPRAPIVPNSRTGYSMSPLPGSQRPSQLPGPNPAQLKEAQERQRALQQAAELKQILSNLEKVDDEGRRSSLLDVICSKEDVFKLPTHPKPPGIATGELKVDLLKHQSQGLVWCMEKENPTLPARVGDPPVQFWQLRMNGAQKYYFNLATKTPTATRPKLGRGALCADSMGLGKTLTIIALIIATRKERTPGFSQATLIVAPLSILSNWEKQIEEHCTPGTLSVYTYYGNKRSLTAEQLQKYDVVITTYQTVTSEHGATENQNGAPAAKKKKHDDTLFQVPWKRVILDEGHNIRNPKTKMAQAVCGLNADRRWVLSGTPIINSPRDLGSILSFLRICHPLSSEDFFKRLVTRPLATGDPAGSELLTALMSHICIRRTKEMQDSEGNSLVPLSPVEVVLVPVTLYDKDRELYDEIETLSTQRVERYINAGRMSAVTSNVLSLLTRMRQIVLHPGLVPANYLAQLRNQPEFSADGPAMPAIRLTPEERAKLQAVLAQKIEDCEECPICFGSLNDPRITSCSHVFCLTCIMEVISRDPKCPMDRRLISTGDLIEPPPPTEMTQAPLPREVVDDGFRTGSSAKIDQLVHLLHLIPATDKSLVFSQFTSFLDKIAEEFDKQGIPYVRFDGRMSAKRRKECIDRFSVPLSGEATTDIPASQTTTSRRRSRATRSYNEGGGDEAMDDRNYVDIGDVDVDDFIDDEDDEMPKKKSQIKGKGKGKAKTASRSIGLLDELDRVNGENPRVMLISLKAGALGLNLTVANNVFLMDPWWQEGIESQAIDRCNRIGQTKPVHVYQLVAENTVESKVIDIQEKKKKMIQEAFSGIKRKETLREKKEARLQDLIALFGARIQDNTKN